MPTIDELMEGKKPGEIKVIYDVYIFTPHYRMNNRWYGFYPDDDKEFMKCECATQDIWELYTEPKKKVKRWLWCSNKGEDVSNCFMTEDERGDPDTHTTKILFSEMEFEE